ncbi:hypothetical protein PPTG_19362 [Phytophthora nicotianae INRA-310]|uniref:HAT C-terminal dimerisation domain-containing protein n=2 Tax=Phytophthora nicotianae (strain INRA-310) TaxID=761204 RepID=W2PDD9_PHYN3|nr:hypothetical protein PPTG_19362 [Phytophthora nicotianae INRA-310]ETM98665.1 hypothetical protein PPTG_19362 [Phytophthora nicotianae INRA-310]
MVAFLVADNCSINKRIATLLDLPLVRCASHRYNLAVNRSLAPYEAELAAVNDLMVQLRHCNNAAELAKHTELKPIKRNTIRWSSTFEMIHRYKRIRDAIRQVEAVEEFIPTGATHKKVVGLPEHLKKLDSVCKVLQDDRTAMADVRVLFDPLIDDYLVMASHQRLKALWSSERKEDSYAVEILRGSKKKRNAVAQSVSYSELAKMVPPTSNTVERLFSQCKLILTPQCACLLPANFEILAFLRVNRDLWNASTLVDVE